MEETTRSQIDDNCNCEDHKCSNCNNTIDKLLAELTALRAWKAKARPFLENYSFYLSMNDNIESLRLERTTLTELLGGSDEN